MSGFVLLPIAAILVWIPTAVFWPYFAGIVITVIGLYVAKGDFNAARGPDKIVALGPTFFAMPMAVFGAQHFTEGKFIVKMIPEYMPGAWFWTSLVGVALLSAALSMVTRKQAGLAATLLAVMLFLFVLMLHIPRVVGKPDDRIGWAVAFRDLAFSCGALAFAETQWQTWRTNGNSALLAIPRVCIAITTLFFGVEQLLHPEYVSGVPLEKLTPEWIPGHKLLAYLAGVIFVVAGAFLIANRHTRLAATCVGAIVLVLMIFVYLPILGASPADIDNGLDYFADTLAFAGAALLLAGAMPRETYGHI
ncbi:MAG: DoxX family membrane protein [Candidatus Acidiferrum sp.]